ncbi:hypothetical protein N7532_008409 [Penicillium argentinense]|uniref:Hydrophobin n=1 Tax=Penicillium argentinense TaxID=1131581 RepID=A0A9W9EXM5_9EURO|nr:uncharacterized protein N7532_008409 [Penicillium argentinense]KAJ5089725.1 hypothetical protein N7532_008409 [Penicillium argentinense]
MKFYTTATTTLLFTTGLACDFLDIGRDCHWEGTAPDCGTINHDIGYVDPAGRTLVGWTRGIALESFCDREKAGGGNCCGDYGHGCQSGYKRLWCKNYNVGHIEGHVGAVVDDALHTVDNVLSHVF